MKQVILFTSLLLLLSLITPNVHAANPGDVIINELMWMGSTLASADEWIELRNMTANPIDLSGWQLTRKSSGVEILMLEIPSGIIAANGFFIISNYDATNSKIDVTPDAVDTDVSLANSLLQIKLYDGLWNSGGALIDTADDGIGNPAAGDNTNKCSMMRVDPPGDGSLAANWFTADIAVGWDAGATEKGTPGSSNFAAGALDHFILANVANQQIGVAFPITITAKDAANSTVFSFTGTVIISDLTGTVTPTVSGNFSSGCWTGNVTISQEKIADIITVTNASGIETGQSNSFDVSTAPSAGDVIINELMWMGSTSSTVDEWIELRNLTDQDINLTGWQLTRLSGGNETFMLEIPSGTIPADGYFLISNYDEANSQIAVTPDLVETAVSLANSQLQIKLYDGQWDGSGNLMDTADDGAGAPAAGDNTNKYSMSRTAPPGDGTLAANWFTSTLSTGWDIGAAEKGTPGSSNYDLDFGDAPDPLQTTAGRYPTKLANEGARHRMNMHIYLGSSIDSEADGFSSITANGDDNDGMEDEDGVLPSQLNILAIGSSPAIEVDVINTTGSMATVKGWIDYDGDGEFEAGESATNTIATSGKVTLNFPQVPTWAATFTFARFRVSTNAMQIDTQSGLAENGEVEDYAVTIGSDADNDGIPDQDEAYGDRDGDAIPDDEDYDPNGWIYDETNGNIISGGTIAVLPSAKVTIIDNGSSGYYRFTVAQNGDYVLSYLPPAGFLLSSACLAQPGQINPDPTTDPNPFEVGHGSKNGTTNKMTNWTCLDNPYYWEFHLEGGDPIVINNNIPLQPQPTNIVLSSFVALVEQKTVALNWITETEPDNAGFNVFRSTQENSNYSQINPSLITAQGNAFSGAEYAYTDVLQEFGTYYYKLQAVSLQDIRAFYGTIIVAVTSVAIKENATPENYYLFQNYPNPFNAETTFEFGLPKATFVELAIYDINGRKLCSLFSEEKPVGKYWVKWDGRDENGARVSSGIYFTIMKSGDFHQTKKMILMK